MIPTIFELNKLTNEELKQLVLEYEELLLGNLSNNSIARQIYNNTRSQYNDLSITLTDVFNHVHREAANRWIMQN